MFLKHTECAFSFCGVRREIVAYFIKSIQKFLIKV